MAVLESGLSQWGVPSDVRDAVRQAVDAVTREGASLVDGSDGDQVTLAVEGAPVAVYLSSVGLAAALEPADAERAQRADSALTLEKSEDSWQVHCRYGRLDPSRLNSMTALLVRALRRYAPRTETRVTHSRAGIKRKRAAAPAADGPRRATAAATEERRRVADAQIPRCPVPGCNLPMVGGSCGFHD